MQIRVKIKDRTLTALLDGEIDHHSAEEIRKAIDTKLAEYDIKDVVMNFEKVSFMDSAGIGVIIGRYRKIASGGGTVTIKSPKPQIMRMIDMSGIKRIVKIENAAV